MKRLVSFLSATLLVACGFDDRVAGGTSSEVPNALHGTVLDSAGKPVAGCAVRMAPSSSWMDSLGRVDSTVTDSAGRWTLAKRASTESVALLFRTPAGAILSTLTLDSAGLTAVRTDTLKRQAWVKGRLSGARGLSSAFLLGTNLQTTTDADGGFVLGPVPAGALRIRLRADSAGTIIHRTESLVTIPGDTASLGSRMIAASGWLTENYAAWAYSRTATLDMTSSGAASTGDQVGFPVPVRLDTLIDFATVKPGEIRFDDGKGVRFPFQIEQWDSAAGKALVWVRLDTANGSSSKHDLRMFWGMAGAKPPADMPLVFDGSNGFAAAWHLTSGTETSLDLSMKWTGSTSTTGVLGTARAFAETGSFATDSVELGRGHSWTVGLWVRLDKKPSGESLLVGVTDGPDSTHWGLSVRDDKVLRVWSGADPLRSLETPLADSLVLGRWTHVAVTFETTTKRIGLVIDATSYPRQTIAFPATSRQRLRGMTGLSGAVDEIRLAKSERAVEWPQLERQTGAPGIPWLKWK
jgi:hypothetical protein